MDSSESTVELAMWAGYRAGVSAEPSTGEMRVRYHGERVTEGQRRALAATVERAEPMQPVLLDAIVAAYPTFREWKPRAKTVTRAGLREVVSLWGLVLTTDETDGLAYVGHMFSCAWDPSGFVVLTHGDRLVAAGGLEVLRQPIKDPARTVAKSTAPTAKARATAKAAAEKAARAPLEPLSLDDEISITLPAWAGFRAGDGAKLSRGEVTVAVGGDCVPEEGARIAPHHERAYRRVVEQAEAAQRLVLDAIVERYPRIRKQFNGLECEMPVRIDRDGLRDLVSLRSVHIHHAQKDEIAYVGYQLDCAWDGEHGIGVMTHLDRVVDLGGADTAILSWIAEKDRRKKSR